MQNGTLNIGRIPYANLFPIFHYLDTYSDNSNYRFFQGVPSRLNQMLRDGKLDISPSSSIEYLRKKDLYLLLPWFSISSIGPIRSILLFSKHPLKELNGKNIAVSSESETSTELLKVILKEFLSLHCSFTPQNKGCVKSIFSSFPAFLLIGDTAMVEAKKFMSRGSDETFPYIFDLGELWHEYTGLPFVYALWVVRKKSVQKKTLLVKQLSQDLMNAKHYAYEKFTSIAKTAPQRKWFSERELVSYWGLISYDFTERHMAGLKLFEKYAFKTHT